MEKEQGKRERRQLKTIKHNWGIEEVAYVGVMEDIEDSELEDSEAENEKLERKMERTNREKLGEDPRYI